MNKREEDRCKLAGGGLLCLVGAVAFHRGSGSSNDKADELASVRRVKQLKDLETLLKHDNRLMVAIRGKIASEKPIKCEFGGLQGVSVVQRGDQLFMKLDMNGEWRKHYRYLYSTRKQVPWYLTDGTWRVDVEGSEHLEGLSLPAVSSTFEGSRTYLDFPLLVYLKDFMSCDCKKDEKKDAEETCCMKKKRKNCEVFIGIQRTESVLPVGTSMTVIGESVKDAATGAIQIQKPKEGPFKVSTKTIDELIEHKRVEAGEFKFLSYVMAGLGVLGLVGAANI